MKDFAGFLGWVVVVGYGIALLNFFMKYFNKIYISKLSKEKKKYVDIYRFIMKVIIRYHRLAGAIASIALIVHFYILYNLRGLSISGLIAGIFMWIVFTFGIYGVYINKSIRGNWLKVHRILSFILIALIIFHIL